MLAYQENNVLDVNSRYAVSVPELEFEKAHVEATTDATFAKVAGLELNAVTATTTYDQKRLDFKTNIKEKTRELDATGQVLLHPDHQEIHLPELAIRTQGIEWRTAPNSQATVNYRGNRIQLDGVRLVSGEQSLDLTGGLAVGTESSAEAIEVHARNVDLQQLQTLALQDRGLTGRITADARISGSTSAPVVDGTVSIDNGGFQAYHYDSLRVKVDYSGTRIGIDAALQQSPTEAITVKGTVPTTAFEASQTTGHIEPTPEDSIDLQVKSTAVNLALVQGFTTPAHQRDRHDGSRRPRRWLGTGSPLPRLRRHQEWRIHGAGGGRHLLGPDDEDQPGARSDADPAVPAARSSW